MAPLHLLCILVSAVSTEIINGTGVRVSTEKLSQPELTVKSPYVMTGHTKTIDCISRNGSLPITYTLFINKTFVEKRTLPVDRRVTSNVTVEERTVPEDRRVTSNVTVEKRTVPEERGPTSNVTVEERTVPEERGATFNVTIYNETSLGPYKCKANNSLMLPVYSEELTFTLQEKLSQPEMTVKSPNVMTGHTKTIHCISRNGSLPITYTLFINKTFVEKRTVPEERGATSNVTVEERTVQEERGATFNVTIYNETSLGPYKCKANNSLMIPVYSEELTFTLQEKLSQPEMTVKSPNVMTGHTKTIHCISRNGSLPITYTLFINKTFVEKRMVPERGATSNVTVEKRTVPEERGATSNVTVEKRTVSERGATSNVTVEKRTVPEERGATSNITVEKRTVPEERGATFNVTIYNETSLGPYKCSANNSLMLPVYSEELTFTLQVEKNRRGYLEWLIPVLTLIGILVIIAFIGLARHKKGRARRQEDQYCVVGPINGREDGSKRCEDQDIEYCSMVLRGPARAAIRTEESVEYMTVAIKRS